MREIEIAGIRVADDTRALICADAGHNPGGNLALACEMAQAAHEAGADIVKFQTRTDPKDVYANELYYKPVGGEQYFGKTYGEHREYIEFTRDEWHYLFDFCRDAGIPAISTPFSFKAVDLLEECGVPAYKVASGDANNYPFLRYIASKGKPMIVSTGGCTAEELYKTHDLLRGIVPFAFLQCTCAYPPPADALSLLTIPWLRGHFWPGTIGLSCHTPTWYPALAAYALGARIFEWHFTTDRKLKGTDNHFSLTPTMLREMRDALNMTHEAMGDCVKVVQPCEAEPTIERRKSIVWAKQAMEWEPVTREHFALKCPGTGIAPEHLDEICSGKYIASYTTGEGEKVAWHDLAEVSGG